MSGVIDPSVDPSGDPGDEVPGEVSRADLERFRWGFTLDGEPNMYEIRALGYSAGLAALDDLARPGGIERVGRQLDDLRSERRREIDAVLLALHRLPRLRVQADRADQASVRALALRDRDHCRRVLREFTIGALDRRAWTPPATTGEAQDIWTARAPSHYMANRDRVVFDALRPSLAFDSQAPDNGDEARGVWLCVGHEHVNPTKVKRARGCGIVFRSRGPARFCGDCSHSPDYTMPPSVQAWTWARRFDTENRTRLFVKKCAQCGGEFATLRPDRQTCSAHCRTAKWRATSA